jgi:hypothetical protein
MPLRTDEEVRHIDDIGPVDPPKADPRMLDIAEKIVDQQRGDFDPSKFVDRYEPRAAGGYRSQAPGAVPDTKVIDLMEALKRSLGQSGEATLQKRPRAANRNKPSPKPAGRPAQAGGVMAIQLHLPARWARQKAGIAIRALASMRYCAMCCRPRQRSVEGYADDMLSDAIYNVERGLERELEDEDPV